jgi:MFS transporter, DHA2 family, multidrug resistance protein
VFHGSRLSENITAYSQVSMERINAAIQLFISKGDAFTTAQKKALAMMKGLVARQAMLMTFNDAFFIVSYFLRFMPSLLLLFTAKNKKCRRWKSGWKCTWQKNTSASVYI